MSQENPLALNVHPKTSRTHLWKSIFIKNHGESVNTWEWHANHKEREKKTDSIIS